MSTTADKIRRFGTLPKGWDYGSGGPAPQIAIDLALKVEALLRANGYPETDAFPGTDGEIAVTGYLDGCSVNIEVTDEGRYTGDLLGQRAPVLAALECAVEDYVKKATASSGAANRALTEIGTHDADGNLTEPYLP